MKTVKKKSNGSTRQPDAIALLTEDHKKVKKLFSDFKKSKDHASNDEKSELVDEICNELTIHAQVEEEIFYPAVRDAIDDDDLMDEADEEHDSAKSLIAQLESMEPDDDHYDAKVIVLGEYIDHHVKEEQEKMFPKAKKAKLDLVELGNQILQRKQELQAESDGFEVGEERRSHAL